jgi:replication factor C subunit 3/5
LKEKKMKFTKKHEPKKIKDLVFKDPHVAQIISDYGAGLRDKHLLLEGPTSSGKSIAASMILKERLSASLGDDYTSVFHGQGLDHRTIKTIEGDWNVQMMFGSAYSVIDEVDFATADGRREIRKFIDTKSFGTLICTTNFLHKLEHAFVSRFFVVNVSVPAPTDWHSRALQILQAEGHAVISAQVQRLMANFSGHARDFIDEVENVHLGLLRARAAAQSNAGPTNKRRSVITNTRPIIVSKGIRLSNGATPKTATPTGNGKSQQ